MFTLLSAAEGRGIKFCRRSSVRPPGDKAKQFSISGIIAPELIGNTEKCLSRYTTMKDMNESVTRHWL